MTKEEKYIISALFDDQNINQIETKKLDFEMIIKIGSSHLILPAIYFNLKSKKILKKTPKDFNIFLEEIFEINKNRNLLLIEEINELSTILYDEKIDHVFTKGAANIIHEIYNDIGERMIGDIDFLYNPIDTEKIKQVLNKNKYKNVNVYNFFKNRHLPRKIKKGCLFAIEAHSKIFDKNLKKINVCELLDSKKRIARIPTLNAEHLFLTNIYNYQINDYGYKLINYSYRSLYDSLKIKRKYNGIVLNIKKDKYLRYYFELSKKLGINSFEEYFTNDLFWLNTRYYFKNRSKIYKGFEFFLFDCIKKIGWKPRQMKEILINKDYRAYLKKIIQKKT